MDSRKLFLFCLSQASAVVKNVSFDQFSDPTPDTEWDVKTLVGHMLFELAWTNEIVKGKSIKQVGDKYAGDLIGNDLQASWELYCGKAKAAVTVADPHMTAHLSYGDVRVEDYLKEAATDQLIHAWDLGAATGQSVEFDPRIAEIIYDYSKPKIPGLADSGLFAPPIEVGADADIQTKLLALYGRRA